MITTLVATALLAAPLAPSEGLELLTLGANQPSLERLDAKCKKGVDLILRAPLAEVRKAAATLSVSCAKPRFPKLAAILDRQAPGCRASDDACAAWLLHARAALVDVMGPDGTPADLAQVLTALAAVGVGDSVDATAANRAVDAASRISDAKADNAAVQRVALSAWLALPATTRAGAENAFAKLIPRVLGTNGDDPEVWGAFVYMAQRANAVDATKQFLDALAETTRNASHRAKAHYLRGCLAMQEKDDESARAAFGSAAKADPFDATYRKAVNDVAAGTKFQCKIVMTPFDTALKEALQPQ
ncbi:MAG: hypothetical protein ACAI38_24830 [Myxococcota bacterium]